MPNPPYNERPNSPDTSVLEVETGKLVDAFNQALCRELGRMSITCVEYRRFLVKPLLLVLPSLGCLADLVGDRKGAQNDLERERKDCINRR
jgi:hypothetical protein